MLNGKFGGTTMAIPRILIIDDEADVGEFIASAAQSMGFECTVTTDAQGFLEVLTPDTNLILLDLIMPDMDGIEMLRLLGKRKCKAGIVLMSGVGERTLESAAQYAQVLGLCIVGHLHKPFQLDEMERILHHVPPSSPEPLEQEYPKVEVQKLELLQAIRNDEFVVYYQPQIDIAYGSVIGVEALVRWNHPTRGLLYPDSFIGPMEKFLLIDELGWIVADRGMRDLRQFMASGDTAFRLSLNASVNSLCDLIFPDTLVAIAEKYGISPHNVTIEITETCLIKELSSTLDTLIRLRMKGVRLSIDDFGTGYATMQQFKNIPATALKIDKTFVHEMLSNDRDRIMVQKTIEMGHDLGMQVVAEGVETLEQLNLLRSYGADGAQGYLFSRPIPAMEMVNWLKIYNTRLMDSHPQPVRLNLPDHHESSRNGKPARIHRS
jgi:EAL domain-containing protein (putative c-di-GMP-specific phosphodiesterase class I)